MDINDSNLIVGWSNTASGAKHAFVYTAATGMTDLFGSTQHGSSVAEAVNHSGVIVGELAIDGTGSRPFRFTGSGSLTLLTLPQGDTNGLAYDINNNGYIVGRVQNFQHAALWTPANQLVDLDTWLDQTDAATGALWTLTSANALNESGDIVGWGYYKTGQFTSVQRAFLLHAQTLVPEPNSAFALGLTIFWLRRTAPQRSKGGTVLKAMITGACPAERLH